MLMCVLLCYVVLCCVLCAMLCYVVFIVFTGKWMEDYINLNHEVAIEL